MEPATATPTITLKDSVEVSENAVFKELEGEAVILNLDTGIYFGLNQTGTRIWNLLAQQGALRKVFAAMAEEYDVAPDSLEKDLLQLVSQLSGKGLVRLVPLPEGVGDAETC